MSLANRSLNAKVISIALVVGLVVAAAVGFTMYTTMVKPVPGKVKHSLIKDMNTFIEAQMNLKVKAGIIGSTAFSLQRNIIEAMAVEDRESLFDYFSGIKSGFAKKTNFKNIGTQLITFDGRSLIRSW
ncbi:MAG: hypothetical protein R3219_09585, partial [Hydrogenovibrio sp.]|nr:hypothetical protein [Hydrogenovibrio sp.]